MIRYAASCAADLADWACHDWSLWLCGLPNTAGEASRLRDRNLIIWC